MLRRVAPRSVSPAGRAFETARGSRHPALVDELISSPRGTGRTCISCYGDCMSGTALLDDLLDPFTDCLDAESAQRVAEFRIAPSVQEKVAVLAERANEGVLTEGERAEYEALINATDFITILKLKARRSLPSNVHP